MDALRVAGREEETAMNQDTFTDIEGTLLTDRMRRPFLGSKSGKRNFLCRRSRLALSHLAALTLSVLVQAGLAFGSEVHALDVAIGNDDLQKVKELIAEHPNLLNSAGSLGATPLHYAVAVGGEEIMAFLLANKANVGSEDAAGNTPLHYAAVMNNKAVIELLLAHGADINARSNLGRTPLHYAAEMSAGEREGMRRALGLSSKAPNRMPVAASDEEALGVLLASGANINYRDNSGCTPLHLAAFNGLNNKVTFLLAHGATVNATDNFLSTPLHFAVLQFHTEVMKSLLANKADVNAPSNAMPKLTIGGEPGRFGLTRFGFYWGTVASSGGDTPLHWACAVGNKDAVELLLAGGADVNAADHDGRTPLHIVDHSGLKAGLKNQLKELISQRGGHE